MALRERMNHEADPRNHADRRRRHDCFRMERQVASQALNQTALTVGPIVHPAAYSGANSSFRKPVATAIGSERTVLFWNLIGSNTILATPLGPRAAPLGSRALAMMHVAMADAVTSIHPSYKPYAVRITGHRDSDEVAAAASAAYGVLVRLFPASLLPLDDALAESLAQVPDGHGKERGIVLGDEVAAQIVALRENDGSSAGLIYTPPTGLGFWQPDPRTGASPFLSWASVTPWTMDTADQFRPEPPPSIYEPRSRTTWRN